MSKDYPDFYTNILELILGGRLTLAAQQVEKSFIRSRTPRDNPWYQLLRIRIALHQSTYDASNELNSHIDFPQLLRAEIHFVRSLVALYGSDFEAAKCELTQASELFSQLKRYQKKLLCDFNAYIAQANIDFNWDNHEQLLILNNLQRASIEHATPQLRALIYRQRAHIYKDLGKLAAAEEDSIKALAEIENSDNLSDIQATLINHCDLLLDADKISQARAAWEKIIPPVDVRHSFSLAYLKARFEKLSYIAADDFDFICPHYRNRAEKIGIEIAKGPVEDLTELERKLLKSVQSAPRQKEELVSMLWPHSGAKQASNRLYQLIFRLNQKLDTKVTKISGFYCLATGQ
jgi:tetratricopeptide (TPR) repeat protein